MTYRIDYRLDFYGTKHKKHYNVSCTPFLHVVFIMHKNVLDKCLLKNYKMYKK